MLHDITGLSHAQRLARIERLLTQFQQEQKRLWNAMPRSPDSYVGDALLKGFPPSTTTTTTTTSTTTGPSTTSTTTTTSGSTTTTTTSTTTGPSTTSTTTTTSGSTTTTTTSTTDGSTTTGGSTTTSTTGGSTTTSTTGGSTTTESSTTEGSTTEASTTTESSTTEGSTTEASTTTESSTTTTEACSGDCYYVGADGGAACPGGYVWLFDHSTCSSGCACHATNACGESQPCDGMWRVGTGCTEQLLAAPTFVGQTASFPCTA